MDQCSLGNLELLHHHVVAAGVWHTAPVTVAAYGVTHGGAVPEPPGEP